MHALARHPAPLPFKLDLRDTANIRQKIVGEGPGAMDDVLSQINEAFRLASELMNELPASQNDPAYLAERCHGIARAYHAAIRMLQPPHGGDMATQQPPPFADDLLRRWRPDQEAGGVTANPFLGSPSSQLGFHTLAEAFGSRVPEMLRTGADVAGTSSGGPVRRVTPSSRGSPPIQPRQGRRRYVVATAWRNVRVLAVKGSNLGADLLPRHWRGKATEFSTHASRICSPIATLTMS